MSIYPTGWKRIALCVAIVVLGMLGVLTDAVLMETPRRFGGRFDG